MVEEDVGGVAAVGVRLDLVPGERARTPTAGRWPAVEYTLTVVLDGSFCSQSMSTLPPRRSLRCWRHDEVGVLLLEEQGDGLGEAAGRAPG